MSRKTALVALSLVFVLASQVYGSTLQIVPTTTLAAEKANNTSASTRFATTSNGDLGAGNVSKVDIRTLLYPGYSGPIYAHLMGWFCMNSGSTATGAGTLCSSHIQVGYNSTDPAQIRAQVEDMISRGINGVIHDWYGPGSNSDTVAMNVLAEAEKHPGFTYMTMVDKGSLKWNSCANNGCSATDALIQQVTYIVNTYTGSPAYLRINGRPVITNFDLDLNFPDLDWNRVVASVPGNPMFLFQGTGGFTHVNTSGSYSWGPTAGLDYLTSFYNTGANYPNLLTVGSVYKGFNDTLASWSLNRVTTQQCGQTWLNTFGRVTSAADGLQIVTWDDYEEGTEIESGIDNCVTVSGSVSNEILSWAISGNENTIDHYTVFVSTDGQNLMPLGQFAAGTRQLDLSSYSLAAGSYLLYIKAVGKPVLRNQMSAAVAYTVASSGTIAPTAVLSLSTTSAVAPATITASTAGSTVAPGATIASSTINWGDGTSSAGPTASHVYQSSGTYTVTAVVSDSFGSSSITAKTLTINPAAVYITEPANGATLASPVHVRAYAVSGRTVDSMIIYLDSADAYLTYSSSLDTYLNMAPGQHIILVKSWDTTGVITRAQVTVNVVNSALTAVLALSTTNGLAPLSVTASTTGSAAPGATITSSVINWGDGTTSAATSATHVYTRPGLYIVTSTVTDNLGRSASKSANVNVAGIVVSSPGASSGSPVLVSAKAVDANAIDAMYVYVDGVTRYWIYSNAFSKYLSMPRGTHKIVIKAWESRSNGLILQSTRYVTVY